MIKKEGGGGGVLEIIIKYCKMKWTVFWYRRISLSATVPGRNLCVFLVGWDIYGADFRAALMANCLRGAFAPVDLRAVYFVLAIFLFFGEGDNKKIERKKKCVWYFYYFYYYYIIFTFQSYLLWKFELFFEN